MKKFFAKALLVLIMGSAVALPLVSFAAEGGTPWSAPSIWPTGFWGPIVWCTGDYLTGTAGKQLGTPATCNNLCDLIGTIINVIYLAMSIALFIIVPILVVWGGIMIMFAGASPGTLETGKKILTGTVMGIVLLLCSYLLVNTVLGVLKVTDVGGFNGDTTACSTTS